MTTTRNECKGVDHQIWPLPNLDGGLKVQQVGAISVVAAAT